MAGCWFGWSVGAAFAAPDELAAAPAVSAMAPTATTGTASAKASLRQGTFLLCMAPPRVACMVPTDLNGQLLTGAAAAGTGSVHSPATLPTGHRATRVRLSAMCFGDDARPPAPPVRGPVGDHGDLVLTSADGTRFAAYHAHPAGGS